MVKKNAKKSLAIYLPVVLFFYRLVIGIGSKRQLVGIFIPNYIVFLGSRKVINKILYKKNVNMKIVNDKRGWCTSEFAVSEILTINMLNNQI